ncbi:MAG: hypothetical protein WCJ09_22225 [Planctomycetota bacterium]
MNPFETLSDSMQKKTEAGIRTKCTVIGSLVPVLLLLTAISLPCQFASAADPAATQSVKRPVANAAVIYWQAFAVMPTLTEEERAAFEAAVKDHRSKVTPELTPVVTRFQNALKEMRRGTKATDCDWELDYSEGPHLLLPHLQKARELARAATLRARIRFAAGEVDAAVDDVLATLILGRHCGRNPIVIGVLVNIALEKLGIDVLAEHLPMLSAKQLDGVTNSLANLPPMASIAECMKTEGESFCGWIERTLDAEDQKLKDPAAGVKLLDALHQAGIGEKPVANDSATNDEKVRSEILKTMTVADVRASLKRLRADYQTLEAIAKADPADRLKQWTAFDAQLFEDKRMMKPEDRLRCLSTDLLPAFGRVLTRYEQQRVRRELLNLAIAVQREGPEAVKSSTSLSHSKVIYTKSSKGFVLSYVDSPDNSESLTVGHQ